MPSFEALFTRYFARVYRFALSLSRSETQAEEITQQTFYQALRHIDQFEGRSDPGTWLCSIAKHEYFQQRRRMREQAFAPDDPVFDPGASLPDDDPDAMRIHRHLHTLKEPYREVFMLRVFGELKYAQIASLFGKGESWARVIYYRAKLQLQQKVREEDEHDKDTL